MLALGLVLAPGCAAPVGNPRFSATDEQARQAIERMKRDPRPLPRPLVLVTGFLNPQLSARWFAKRYSSIAREARIIPVSIGSASSFDECRARVIDAVEQAFPSDDPQWTTEVDVVGMSLGGLVARYAAASSRDPAHPKRLRIARLFTISSPHTGATLADRITLIEFHRDMRAGSQFLQYVADHDRQATYELYPYTHLDDDIVGEQHAAPPGVNPMWLANPPGLSAHLQAMLDPRIFADIALRLREEPALSQFPSPPLPSHP